MKTAPPSPAALATASSDVDLTAQRAERAKKAFRRAKTSYKAAKKALKKARETSRKKAKLAKGAQRRLDTLQKAVPKRKTKKAKERGLSTVQLHNGAFHSDK